MKKTVLSLAMMALASVSHADLGLDDTCNGNGTDQGEVSFNGDTYLRCDLPTSIVAGGTVELGVENDEGDQIVWALPGIVYVGNGSMQNANPNSVDNTVLDIETGAQIAGAVDSNSALVITRGAQINAQGTSSNPVVFSSLDDNMSGSGEWGGLVLSGFGESNNCPSADGMDSCEMEGVAPGHYYGGGANLNQTMSSGSLEYVVIAEGGHEVATDSEINGLTLYAVNSTTSIQNIHVHNNQDDGIEFFGGDAAVVNAWLTCNEDDSVDWDEGYHGFLVSVAIAQGDNAGYALELASNPNNPDSLPRASATVSNMSIDYIGNSVDPAVVPVPFRLKEGTDGSFSNVVIGTGYDVQNCDETDGAYASASSPWSVIEYGCTPVDGDPSAWDLPASNTNATGFTAASFWPAPACD